MSGFGARASDSWTESVAPWLAARGGASAFCFPTALFVSSDLRPVLFAPVSCAHCACWACWRIARVVRVVKPPHCAPSSHPTHTCWLHGVRARPFVPPQLGSVKFDQLLAQLTPDEILSCYACRMEQLRFRPPLPNPQKKTNKHTHTHSRPSFTFCSDSHIGHPIPNRHTFCRLCRLTSRLVRYVSQEAPALQGARRAGFLPHVNHRRQRSLFCARAREEPALYSGLFSASHRRTRLRLKYSLLLPASYSAHRRHSLRHPFLPFPSPALRPPKPPKPWHPRIHLHPSAAPRFSCRSVLSSSRMFAIRRLCTAF